MKFVTVTEALSPFNDFSKIPPDMLSHACKRGTAVHLACEHYASGLWVMPLLTHEENLYFKSFKLWFDEYVEKTIIVEPELIDEKLGLIGHPDSILLLRGDTRPTIVDYKTPATRGKTWGCQLSAYFALAKEHKPHRIISLRLKRDGSGCLIDEYKPQAADWSIFLNALACYRHFNQ